MLKIVHILNQMADAGNGIVCATVDLACEQAKAGHEVYVLSAGGGLVSVLEQHGVTHVEVCQKARPFVIARALATIHRLLKAVRPDVVHAQMMTGVVLAWLLKPFHSYRLVSTLHNEWNRHALLMGLADVVITPSARVKETMMRRGISEARLRVVLNGTVGGFKEQRAGEAPFTLPRPSITTVAGLYERKGIACLIRAFEKVKRQVPEAHLYLVGHGDDRARFEKLAADSPAGKDVHFEGFQRFPEHYLRQTDVFVLASSTESFGLALSEARSAGCAVIGSNVGGIPEVLEQGRAGQLFTCNDVEQLAEIILRTLEPEQLAYWKKQAQENLDWLSAKRMCEETLEVYVEGRE